MGLPPELEVNLLDFPGYSYHTIHLLYNEEMKSDSNKTFKMICKFVEMFSDVLNSTPKAKGIFNQSSRALGTKGVHFYSPTRFWNLPESWKLF